MSHRLYAGAADAVVILHASYVLFVVLGELLILLGWWRRWEWVRNLWFRGLHVLAILTVVAESWLGITCPLTTLEARLRSHAGQPVESSSFIGRLVHDLLFIDWPNWGFTVVYSLFGALVVISWVLLPPRWRSDGARAH